MLNWIRTLRSHPRGRRISNLGILSGILALLYEGLIFWTWVPFQWVMNKALQGQQVAVTDIEFITLAMSYIFVVIGYFVVENYKYTTSLEIQAYFQNRTIEEQATHSLMLKADVTRAEQMTHYKVAANTGDSVMALFFQVGPIALGLVVLICAFAYFSYTLSAIVILVMAVSGCYLFFAAPFLKQMRLERIEDDARIEAAKMQRIEEFSIMHSLGLEDIGASTVIVANDILLQKELSRHPKWNMVLAPFNLIPTVGKISLVFFIVGMITYGVINRDPNFISIGYVLLAWAVRMEQKSQEIQNLAHTLIGGKVSWDFLEKFRTSKSIGSEPRLWPEEIRGAVNLKSVSVTFVDDDGKPFKALDNISIEIEPGECVVIYGPNGHGKTTLLKLLQKIPQISYTGSVKIDNVELREIDSKKYRQEYLSVVFQELDLIRGTVYSNVAISKPSTTEREVVNALQRVGYNLPLEEQIPLHKNVSEFGKQLSGGQKQKIALARAFHRDYATLHLIDEPTSALDSASAEKVIAEYIRLAKRREKTIIIVTHDERLKRYADFRVINLEYGKILNPSTA